MKPIPILLLVSLFLVGCEWASTPIAARPASVQEQQILNVFAAASLADAFGEIGKDFEAANPGVAVVFNFAGSQALRTQIQEGAPADVFASANRTEMDALVTDGIVAQEAPQVFLTNRLVVILPGNNPAGLKTLEDLTRPGIKIILAAEEAPVGRYARQALEAMNGQFGIDFKDKVLANVVSNEDNVKQVTAKIQLGEGDAGIVYTSDSVAASGLTTIEIPAEVNVIAKYPIAALTRSSHAELAEAFVSYVLSAQGQVVLQKWGFAPAQ